MPVLPVAEGRVFSFRSGRRRAPRPSIIVVLAFLAASLVAAGCRGPSERTDDAGGTAAARAGANRSAAERDASGSRATGAPGAVAAPVVEDAAGRTVRLAAPAGRVVSLVPAATDLILALGAADRLVARTRYDTDARLVDLPSIGGGLTPSIEGLAALRPELVIAWRDRRDRDIVGRLDELGTAAYSVRMRTLAAVERVTRDLGELLGRPTAADSLISSMRAGLDSVRRAVDGRPRPSVLYLVSADPVFTTGAGTFIHEIIGVAGGRNIFGDVGRAWPEVSLEAVLRRDPDVIVMSGGDAAVSAAEALRRRPGWRELDAVREGRVIRVEADLFNRPGPRVAEAARALARRLHPAAFGAERRP